MYNVKYSKALAIIEEFEKIEDLPEEDYLSSLILKGNILNNMNSYEKTSNIGEQAYQLSKNLENKFGILDSLFIKAHCIFLGKVEESLDLILQTEVLLETLQSETQKDLIQEKYLL